MMLVDTTLPASFFSAQFQQTGVMLTSEYLFTNISRALWQFTANIPQFSLLRESFTAAQGASIIASSSRAGEPIRHAYATSQWNLDRIDQVTNALDGQYNPGTGYTGQGTHAYIVDTGVTADHPELAGRISLDFTAFGAQLADDNGHGSHVAGIVAATTYGVAKLAHVHSYKALRSTGSGTMADLAAALTHLLAHLQKPAVINLSLTYDRFDPVIDALLTSLMNAGAVITAAAGNSNTDACSTYPCITSGVLCVGATTILDQRSSFSNYGSCVDIWAPGSSIVSLNKDGVGTATLSGTSMSAPACAGVACLYFTANPNAPPSMVSLAIINRATKNQLDATSLGPRSSNDLLYAVWGSIPTTSSVTRITTVGTTSSPTATGSIGTADSTSSVSLVTSSNSIASSTTSSWASTIRAVTDMIAALSLLMALLLL